MIGYDNLPLNYGLLLDLTMRENTGLFTYDRAKPHHIMTLHGTPAWASLALNDLSYLDFNQINPDWLDCPQADTVDLDFTTEDFSIAMWINMDAVGQGSLICRCSDTLPVDGWAMYVGMNDVIGVVTVAAGPARDYTASAINTIVVGTWQLIGMTKNGTSVRVYSNGIDVSETIGVHEDILTSNHELHIGIDNDETTLDYDGQMWRPRIWGSRALTAIEHRQIFTLERQLFGV